MRDLLMTDKVYLPVYVVYILGKKYVSVHTETWFARTYKIYAYSELNGPEGVQSPSIFSTASTHLKQKDNAVELIM